MYAGWAGVPVPYVSNAISAVVHSERVVQSERQNRLAPMDMWITPTRLPTDPQGQPSLNNFF